MSRPPKFGGRRGRVLQIPDPPRPPLPECAPLPLERERRPHPDPGPAVDCVRWACACGDRGYWLSAQFADIAEQSGRSHQEHGTPGSNPPTEDA